MNPSLTSNVDILRQNYREMSETGIEKLKQVSEQILSIYNIVNEKNQKQRMRKKILNRNPVWDFK